MIRIPINFIITVLLLTVLGCGNNFSAQNQRQSLESFYQQQIVVGTASYKTHCAQCHGPLENSQKRGRTAGEIFAAIGNIDQMKFLEGTLSNDKVYAIAKVLEISNGTLQEKFTCLDPRVRGLGENSLKRLTRVELVNTLNSLVGPSVMSNSAIQNQLLTLPEDIIKTGTGDVAPAPPDILPRTMLNIASSIVDATKSSSALHTQIFGNCGGSRAITPQCVDTFVKNFGARVYRRPLADAEVADHLNMGVSTDEDLHLLLTRLLLSPKMVFHVELGDTEEVDRVHLTQYEVASRISYLAAGTMPDAELLAAASRGELSGLAAVQSHARRLILNNSNAQQRLDYFFRYYSQYDQAASPFVGAADLLNISSNGLQEEIITETQDFIDHIVFQKSGSYQDLMTSVEVFPRTDRMATILESTTTNNSNPTVTNENHRGLLLRPSILASSAASTQAYHRAALIREGFLCEDLGAPPANAVADRLDSLGDLSSLSNRERLTAMTDAPACISCHQRLNPIGFAFEGFDQLGAVRDVETVFANNSPTGTHPLDLLVGDTFLADQSGQSLSGVNGPQEIVDAVAFGVAGRACFAEKLYKFLRAREFTEHDYCALSEIEKTLGNENSILEAVVLSIGTEDIFWRAKGE